MTIKEIKAYLIKYLVSYLLTSCLVNIFAKKGTFPYNDFFNTIQDMGSQDCVRKFVKDPIQTHHHSLSKFPWKLDHMFATKELFDSFTNIVVPQIKI